MQCIQRYAVFVIACVLAIATPKSALALQGASGAQQATPQVRVNAGVSQQNVNLGDTLIYQISIDGVSQADMPALPASDAYTAEFLGGRDESSRSAFIVNGRQTNSSTLRYVMQWRITPTKAGPASIASFPIEVGGVATLVPRVEFSVTETASSPQFPLTLECDRTSGYVGEPIRVKLVWTVGGGVRSAAFNGPDGGTVFDILALDPRPPQSRPNPVNPRAQQQDDAYPIVPFLGGQAVVTRTQATLDGRTVTAFAMELVITPREAGHITVGPYRVVFDQVVGQRQRSFFDAPWDDLSQTQRAVSTSNELVLDIKALPSVGRPSNFNGLIGRYTIEAQAAASEANVGDPIPLTLMVRGPEPMDGLMPPALDGQKDFVEWFKPAPEGWEKPVSSGGAAMDGSGTLGERKFTTTVRPKSDKVTQVPPIELPYFDTQTGRYAVARSEPIPLKVQAVREVTAADAVQGGAAVEGGLSNVRVPSGAVGGAAKLSDAAPGVGANTETLDALVDQRVSVLAMIGSPTGAAVVGLPPVVLAAALVVAKRRRATDRITAVRRAAIAEARRIVRGASTTGDVWRGVRVGLEPFVNVPDEAVTASDAERMMLVREDAARDAAALLRDLEAAAYDGANVGLADVKGRAEKLFGELAQ